MHPTEKILDTLELTCSAHGTWQSGDLSPEDEHMLTGGRQNNEISILVLIKQTYLIQRPLLAQVSRLCIRMHWTFLTLSLVGQKLSEGH